MRVSFAPPPPTPSLLPVIGQVNPVVPAVEVARRQRRRRRRNDRRRTGGSLLLGAFACKADHYTGIKAYEDIGGEALGPM